jgi:hypothetical protein
MIAAEKTGEGMEFKAKIHFIHGSIWGMIQGWIG